MDAVVPGVLAIACAVLALWTYSLVRKERLARRDASLVDRELHAAGEAKAAAHQGAARSPLTSLLHEAGLDVGAVRWFTGVLAAAFLLFCVGAALGASPAVGAVFFGVTVLGAFVRIAVLRRRRRALLDVQFVGLLPQISASVRSSLTLERAVRVAAARLEDPLREEVTRVLADAAYGVSLSEAFDDMARRTGSADVRALAAAIRIQQRFGGAIAPALDMVAAHAAARRRASFELRTELAGTRLAKWFVAAAMPAVFLIMLAANADFARFYAEEPLGWAVMGAAVVSELLGLAACQRITSCQMTEA